MTRRAAVGFALLSALLLVVPVSSQTTGPRLLVVLVVDQMRADYLNLYRTHWTDGFKTLVADGAVFENAAQPYADTTTCAGHATIATGAFPRTHGIIDNAWWDRDKEASVDCSLDESAAGAHISYGRPARAGNSPRQLTADTLGDQLRRRSPASRVVALSQKPDSAVMLAGHGGDVIAWFDPDAGAFVTSHAYSAAPTKALADFIAANPMVREFSATWALLKDPDSYINPDATTGQRPPVGWDGLFPHEIGGPNGPDARSPTFWQQSPLSDRYLGRMAAAVTERLELGLDDNPDLLAASFAALDLVGHSFGPDSREAEDVLVSLDRTLGSLIDALDQRIGRSRYVLALTGDHGVTPVPRPPTGGRVIREEIQERVEELLQSRWGQPRKGHYAVVQGPCVYFGSGIVERLRGDSQLQAEVRRTISEFPGVSRVLPADELSASSGDPIVRAAALSYVASRSGDLVIVPQPGWIIVGRNSTSATTHGSANEDDRRVPLILFGGPVRAGRFAQAVTPADIAPTLASLVGIALPRADGRVLQEALK